MSNGTGGGISTVGIQDEKVRKCIMGLIEACRKLSDANDALRVRIEKIERNRK